MTGTVPSIGAASPVANKTITTGVPSSTPTTTATPTAEVASSTSNTTPNFGIQNRIAAANSSPALAAAFAPTGLLNTQAGIAKAQTLSSLAGSLGNDISSAASAIGKLFGQKSGEAKAGGGGQDKQSVAQAGKAAEQDSGRQVADASNNNVTQDLAKAEQTDRTAENLNATETNSITDTNEQTQVAMTSPDDDKPGQADWEAAGALDSGSDSEMA